MSVNINHQLEQVNNLKITTVGTGASVGTAGIVTYYGDGSQLSGINAGGGGGGGGNVTVRTVNNYTATNGQTQFPSSGTISFTPSYVDVFYNGVRLEASEYTENVSGSTGTSITLATAAGLNDILDIVAYDSVGIATVNLIGDITPQLGGDLDLNGHNITGTGNMNITGIATANGGQLQTEDDVIGIVIALG